VTEDVTVAGISEDGNMIGERRRGAEAGMAPANGPGNQCVRPHCGEGTGPHGGWKVAFLLTPVQP
jgi:hypothetical protein